MAMHTPKAHSSSTERAACHRPGGSLRIKSQISQLPTFQIEDKIAISMICQWLWKDGVQAPELGKEVEATWLEEKKPGKRRKTKMMMKCGKELMSLQRYGRWEPQRELQKDFLYLLIKQRYFAYSKGETPTTLLSYVFIYVKVHGKVLRNSSFSSPRWSPTAKTGDPGLHTWFTHQNLES